MINKTDIEYGDRAWNFQTGCLHDCPYCWARKLTERFSEKYPNGFNPTFYQERFEESFPKKPAKILVCFMGDLWGNWVKYPIHLRAINRIGKNKQHQFLLLTKNEYPDFAFPSNCWLGITATNQEEIYERSIKEALGYIKWLSLEPLLEPIIDIPDYFDWIVVGAQTNPKVQPKEEWIEEIIDQCTEKNIPIWLKNNLGGFKLQEYPDFY